MFKRFFLPFLFGLMSLCSCSSDAAKTDSTKSGELDLYELTGNISRVVEERYEATRKDGVLIKNGMIARNIRTFDTNGNLIEERIYGPEGELEERIENVWPEEGGSMAETRFYDRADNLVKVLGYEYDAAGNTVVNTQYDGHMKRLSQYVNTYDKNNYLIGSDGYTGTGYLDNITEYTNDNAGRVIEEQSFERNGDLIYSYVLDRDDSGRIIEGITYDKAGALLHSHTNEYDQVGNLTAWVGTYATEIYSYVYDKQGNWTRKEVLCYGNNASHIIERVLTYY